jgi:hypothetical protein
VSAERRLIWGATVLGIIAATAISFLALHRQLADKRSGLGRLWRSVHGEYREEQYYNDLVDDIRHIPELAKLQPWAVATMEQFRASKLQGNTGTHLYWADQTFELSPQETPEFMKKYWGHTNRFGEVFPQISIVLSNGLPDYVVIDWGLNRGVVLGSTNYCLSFHPDVSNEIRPGIYTYWCGD